MTEVKEISADSIVTHRTESSKRFWAGKYLEARESDGVRVTEFSELSGISSHHLYRWLREYHPVEYKQFSQHERAEAEQ